MENSLIASKTYNKVNELEVTSSNKAKENSLKSFIKSFSKVFNIFNKSRKAKDQLNKTTSRSNNYIGDKVNTFLDKNFENSSNTQCNIKDNSVDKTNSNGLTNRNLQVLIQPQTDNELVRTCENLEHEPLDVTVDFNENVCKLEDTGSKQLLEHNEDIMSEFVSNSSTTEFSVATHILNDILDLTLQEKWSEELTSLSIKHDTSITSNNLSHNSNTCNEITDSSQSIGSNSNKHNKLQACTEDETLYLLESVRNKLDRYLLTGKLKRVISDDSIYANSSKQIVLENYFKGDSNSDISLYRGKNYEFRNRLEFNCDAQSLTSLAKGTDGESEQKHILGKSSEPNENDTRVKLNTIQNLYSSNFKLQIPFLENNDLESTKNATAEMLPTTNLDQVTHNEIEKECLIAETDIDCLMQELLVESKSIKDTIILTGIKEEREPLFTCNDTEFESTSAKLLQKVCNETYTENQAKKDSNTLDYSILDNIKYVIDTILDNIPNNTQSFQIKSTTNNQSCCNGHRELNNNNLEQNGSPVNDSNINSIKFPKADLNKYKNTKMFKIMNSFWKLNKESSLRHDSNADITLLPAVTINNLSTRRLNIIKTDDRLINCVKKSAALLVAIYNEMKDYSYHNTSKILNDLCETVNLNTFLEKRNNKLLTKPICKNMFFERSNRRLKRYMRGEETYKPNPHSNYNEKSGYIDKYLSDCTKSPTHKKDLLIELMQPNSSGGGCFQNNECIAGPSFSACTDFIDSAPSSASSSPNLLMNVEISTSNLLPNLKYTYFSQEEVNTLLEIKKIEESIQANDHVTEDNSYEFNLSISNNTLTSSNS